MSIVNKITNLARKIINRPTDKGNNLKQLVKAVTQICMEDEAMANACHEFMSAKTPAEIVKNSSGNSALHLACQKGYSEVVLFLIYCNHEVNVRNNLKETPLHVACKHNKKDIVATLIDNGANVNAVSGLSETPLHLAARTNDVDTVKLLLRNNADIKIKNKRAKTPLTIAYEEGHSALVGLLIIEHAIKIPFHPQ